MFGLQTEKVMLDRHGRMRVMDFGLARSDHASAPTLSETSVVDEFPALDVSVTRTHALMGTPAYMAPEQHRGLEINARTDQFSFYLSRSPLIEPRRIFPEDPVVRNLKEKELEEP